MAIKKVPRGTQENTIVRKSFHERAEESRLIRLQQKALADLNESKDEDAVDSSIEDVQVYPKTVRCIEEMGNENLLINDEVKDDYVEEEIEMTKGVDETYKKQVTEAEVPGMVEDMSSKCSDDSSTELENMLSAFPTKFRLPNCQRRIVSDAIKGVLTIVFSKKNSFRMIFTEKIFKHIGNFKEVQIGIAEKGIIIFGKSLTEAESEGVFTVKKQGKAYVIYSAPLIKEITKEFSIDYSIKVSHTFSGATYGELDGKKAVFIMLV